MSGRMHRKAVSEMDGGSLIPPQVVAVEEGRQEMLKQSHIKVNSNYFAIDPNLDFDASTILCEDRVYVCDQTPDPTQPITWTIQPQFNVFRSLSESRFVFLLNAVIGTSPPTTVSAGASLAIIPNAYWSALFVNNIVININNVACNDQHSRTAQYAHFVKTVLTEANLKVAYVMNPATVADFSQQGSQARAEMYGIAGEDLRTLSEGIINTDWWAGLDEPTSYTNSVLQCVAGFGCDFGNGTFVNTPEFPSNLYTPSGQAVPTATRTGGKISIELTYRPRDGIFQQPKLLPPGVNLNYVLNLNTLGTWASGFSSIETPLNNTAGAINFRGLNPDFFPVPYTYTIVRAQYYERQYTCTQTALKAYQSLIMRQPLYYSCLTSNTLLFPVATTQTTVQLTNVFSGRLPNIVVVAMLNQSAGQRAFGGLSTSGNIYQLLTYSPLPARDRSYTTASPPALLPADCINSALLTVNGRVYPHLWTSNMQSRSNQDLMQWYEQYRQCSLVCKDSGRPEIGNLATHYKMDNTLLSFGEFKANLTLLCFNIRRNGTVISKSGDKEVGGIDMLVNINGTNHPNAQLMVVGINTDSLCSITDGGSTTSFVF